MSGDNNEGIAIEHRAGGQRRLPELHTLWVGQRLSWVECLCIASWIAQGHHVVIWTYQPVDGIPEEVDVRRADEILPKSTISYHRATGSVALFSNRFRYELLTRFPVTWVDADIFLIRPIANPDPYLFGWEISSSVCTAVMRLPQQCPVLSDLTRFTGARVPVPPWWTAGQKRKQRLLGMVGLHSVPEDMDWSAFGPHAFTDALIRNRLDHRAQTIDVFYPVHWTETALFFGPAERLHARLTDKTVSIHLWSSSNLRDRRHAQPPQDSWIANMCRLHRVNP